MTNSHLADAMLGRCCATPYESQLADEVTAISVRYGVPINRLLELVGIARRDGIEMYRQERAIAQEQHAHGIINQ